MSINRRAADVTEHTAAFTTFDQTVTGGSIGNATLTQQGNGYDEPNVQAAIDDLFTRITITPGAVFQSISSIDPSVERTVSYSQSVQLTVTGTPTANGNITVAGATVAVLTTDTAIGVATKIAAALSAQAYISSATRVSAVVTYTYVDSNAHPVDNKTQNGVTLSTQTLVHGGAPGYLGYGSWELIGSETKFTRTIYNWLRIA